MATKYRCDFYSENVDESGSDQQWRIDIDSASYSGAINDFRCTSDGFTLNMDGGDDNMFAPIKTTSVSFNMVLENATLEGIVDELLNVATGNEDDFSVAIYNYYAGSYRKYWVGYLIGDLVTLDDTSINRIINIQATDGISLLKYKEFDPATFGGSRSMINLIKICLDQLPLITNYYNDTDEYIAHTPYWYNEGMLGTSTWDSTWLNDVNHDPLALCRVNPVIFKNSNGKYWSYYKVLENILACFQLRIMRTQINKSLGTCVWYIQSPLVYHGNDDDDNFDDTQRIFYHSKVTDTANDIALSYSSSGPAMTRENISQIANGSKEMFLPPLFCYKSIYNHNILDGSLVGPINFSSFNDLAFSSGNLNRNHHIWNVDIDLDGLQESFSFGQMQYYYGISGQRLMVSGYVTIGLFDQVYLASEGYGGFAGYGWESAVEYFNNNYASFFGNYIANETSIIYPRIGLRALVDSEKADGSYERNAFWYAHTRQMWLFGGVEWNNGQVATTSFNGICWGMYDSSGTIISGNSNWLGINNNGLPSGLPYDEDGVCWWGTDIGNEDGLWCQEPTEITGEPVEIDSPNDNHYYFWSPMYHTINDLMIFSSGTTLTEANAPAWYAWAGGASTALASQPFSIITPKIPWPKETEGGDFGWARLMGVELWVGLIRDRVNTYYACAKDWTNNKELAWADRGLHYYYELNEVNVNMVGVDGGASVYDYSIGSYNNENGSPSDEEVQEPEIVIGDEPEFDPLSSESSDETQGFSGVFIGQFTIISTPNSNDIESGNATQDWRTTHMTGTEDMKLHKGRAKMGIAHRYCLKNKLNLNIIDRSTSFSLNRFAFASLFNWTSGDWYQNQAGANLGFIPTGGSFVAGSGLWKLTLEDCVTYRKTGLTDTSYSSSG
tara:strand:+ start:12311 stop:14995 length:2685 start_codon:yes stop_codon:yes gene_type:complete